MGEKDPLDIGREELGFPPGQDPHFTPQQLKIMRFLLGARKSQLERQSAHIPAHFPPYTDIELRRKLDSVNAALRVLRRNRPPS